MLLGCAPTRSSASSGTVVAPGTDGRSSMLARREDGAIALGPRFQFRLWCLVVLVAACALVFGMDRYIHDQFSPGNAQARG